MKRFIAPLALLVFGAATLTACSSFLALNEVDFNNTVVTQINENSMSFEESAKSYNELIPDIVTEKTEFEDDTLETLDGLYKIAKNETEETKNLIELKSKNLEQETAADAALSDYLRVAEEYLAHHNAMLEYYSSKTYQKDLSQVEILDGSLRGAYGRFIEANNDLVEALQPFVGEE